MELTRLDVHVLFVIIVGLALVSSSLSLGSENVSSPISSIADKTLAVAEIFRPNQRKVAVDGRNLRRQRRDPAAETVILGLNSLGIFVSVFNPVVGAVPLILGALLSMLFGVTGDPQAAFREMIFNERAQQQKQKLISLRLTMEAIVRLPDALYELRNERMRTLFDIMNTGRCTFMHRDGLRSSAAYFKEFAHIHLAVNLGLVMIYPGSYDSELHDNVRDYVRYAQYVIQQLAAEGRYVRDQLGPPAENWTRILPPDLELRLRNEGSFRSWQTVAIRLRSSNEWLSCDDASRASCTTNTCPRTDIKYREHHFHQSDWRCWGEVFQIYAINSADGIVRSCSQVGLMHSYNAVGGSQMWMSWNRGRRVVDKKPCPRDGSGFNDGGCAWEVWQVQVYGQECGEPVKDRDVITLYNSAKNANNGYPVYTRQAMCYYTCAFKYTPVEHYIIVDSSIGRDDYLRRLICT